jgi:hypothetical protein
MILNNIIYIYIFNKLHTRVLKIWKIDEDRIELVGSPLLNRKISATGWRQLSVPRAFYGILEDILQS